VTELHAQISSQDNTADLVDLLEDLDNLKGLQWRGDIALLPRGQLASGPWETMACSARGSRGGLWESIRAVIGARILGRQKEIRVDDGVRGLALLGENFKNRCTVLVGDNRRPEVHAATRHRCHRVMLGLIPVSRDGFPVAVSALQASGGYLHVHWNTRNDEEEATARAVAQELETLFREERGNSWTCTVEHVQKIKWFAPHVRHVRIDVRCNPK